MKRGHTGASSTIGWATRTGASSLAAIACAALAFAMSLLGCNHAEMQEPGFGDRIARWLANPDSGIFWLPRGGSPFCDHDMVSILDAKDWDDKTVLAMTRVVELKYVEPLAALLVFKHPDAGIGYARWEGHTWWKESYTEAERHELIRQWQKWLKAR